MTLNECRACKELISPDAKVCCHCGQADPRNKRKKGFVFTVMCLLFTLGLFLLTEAQ